MSLINENVGIKIKDVRLMSSDKSSVNVAARPYHALVFRLCGSASFFHDDYKLKTNEGDIFFMPAGYSYKAIYHEKNEILVVHFESDLIAKMENFPIDNKHMFSKLFNKLYDIWNEKAIGYYYYALSLMSEILKNISIQFASVFPNGTIKAFENAVEYMESFYTSSDFSISEMIKKAHMSNTYFRKLFIDKFNVTPAKYLMNKRVNHAELLLSTGRYSIKEVAKKSGFNDEKYFCRIIKKIYGVPPSKLYSHLKNE